MYNMLAQSGQMRRLLYCSLFYMYFVPYGYQGNHYNKIKHCIKGIISNGFVFQLYFAPCKGIHDSQSGQMRRLLYCSLFYMYFVPYGYQGNHYNKIKHCIKGIISNGFVFQLYFAPCKGIHDSLGFWIPPCGFRIPSTGFRIPAQWIPDSKKGWIPIFFLF